MEVMVNVPSAISLGDNPSRSTDSRRFGPVPASAVEAVAVCRIAPFRWL